MCCRSPLVLLSCKAPKCHASHHHFETVDSIVTSFLRVQADQGDSQLCSKTTGPDLKETCAASCSQACTAALNDYTERDSKFTGYSIDAKAKDKLSRSCVRQCTYECAKPGDKYGFAIPFR